MALASAPLAAALLLLLLSACACGALVAPPQAVPAPSPAPLPVPPQASECLQAVQDLPSRSMEQAAMLAMTTGRSLPFDAGKYRACTEIPDSHYLLVSMKATLFTGGPAAPIPAELGLCVPSACGREDAWDLLNSKTMHSLIPELQLAALSNVSATCAQTDLQTPGAGTFVTLVIVGLVVLLVLAATIVRLLAKRRDPSVLVAPQGLVPAAAAQPSGAQGLLQQEGREAPGNPTGASAATASGNAGDGNAAAATAGERRPGLLVQAFGLVGSGGSIPKLLEVPPYKPTDCLNGVRVLSMIWIILGHTFLMPTAISGYGNMQDVVESPLNRNAAENNPFMMTILSAQSGVDTFFFLSGFLLSLLTLQEMRNRRGKLNVGAAIVLRYLRLTPSLAFAMLVYWQIWPHLASGPFAPRFQDSISRRCIGSWWSELTYTLNFIPFDSDAVCMGWTWYLGDDMIFFILAMGILPLYYHRRALGCMAVVCVSGASLAITVWLIVRYDLSIYVFDQHYQKYSYYAYSKPYTRAPAYLVGVATAWLKEILEERGFTRESRPNGLGVKLAAKAAGAVAGSVLLFLVFIPATDFGTKKNSWGTAASAIYLTFGRPVWAACWAAITLLCYYGYLPVVDAFLSHRCWTPLARLTYGAYLAHPLVIKLAAGCAVQYYTFSAQDILYRWAGNCVLSFSCAFVLWVLVERPAMTLTTAALKKRTGTSAQEARALGQYKEAPSPATTTAASAGATQASSPSAAGSP